MTDKPRPDYCCGACPGVVVNPAHTKCEACRTGYDCTCRDNPACPKTDPIALAREWSALDDSTDACSVSDALRLASRLADALELEQERANLHITECAAADAEVKRLDNDNLSYRRAIESLGGELLGSEEEIARLKEQMGKLRDENQRLAMDLDDYESDVDPEEVIYSRGWVEGFQAAQHKLGEFLDKRGAKGVAPLVAKLEAWAAWFAAERDAARVRLRAMRRRYEEERRAKTGNIDALNTTIIERNEARAIVSRVQNYLQDECGPFVAADGVESYRGASREKLLEILRKEDSGELEG
ncbi:hypothetical protein PP301_gp079 [Gordonia phage GMA2]|uniref:Uncharacterized protein n=1 Tax=Gordonia phage GMA2 TaxID=1647283 RepID=A0A0K0N7B3_9CAUD|nr:hypothetical protein PP301_gp079 [Gordonia phage GMA2]AKJ72643.1 hypothetical protein GMA2_105 [Gordonia phage GMA2]